MIPIALLAWYLPALAADSQDPRHPETVATTGEALAMSDIPIMKEQRQRMAVLMEQLSKESDPDVRRRIMAEAMYPQ